MYDQIGLGAVREKIFERSGRRKPGCFHTLANLIEMLGFQVGFYVEIVLIHHANDVIRRSAIRLAIVDVTLLSDELMLTALKLARVIVDDIRFNA